MDRKILLLLCFILTSALALNAYRPTKSVEECLAVIKKNPQNDKAYVELGDAYLKEKKYNKAKEAYEKAMNLNPKNAAAYYGLSEVYRKQEKYKDALDMALIASSLLPLKARYRGQVGLIYYKMGKIDKAIKNFKNAIAVSVKKKGFYYSMLGNCYIKQGKYDEAIKMFQKVLDERPWDKRVYADIARAYYKAGNKAKGDEYRSLAGDAWFSFKEEPQKKKYKRSEGWKYYKSKDYEKAIKVFKDDITKNPNNPDPYIGLVYTYNKKGDLNTALKYANKAVEKAKDYSRAYSARAFIQEKLKNIDKAIKDYKKALKLDETDNFSRERIAKLLYKKRKYKDAATHIEEIIKTEPDNVYFLKLLGNCYINLKKYKDAMEIFKKALKIATTRDKRYIKKRFAYAGYKYGLILEKEGKKTESQRIFKEVAEIADDTKYGKKSRAKITKK